MKLLPPRPFLDSILFRVVLLWAVLRAVSATGASASGVPAVTAWTGPPHTTLWLAAFVLLALRVDMARRREIVFLANLGYSFRRTAVLAGAACMALDVGLRLLLA